MVLRDKIDFYDDGFPADGSVESTMKWSRICGRDELFRRLSCRLSRDTLCFGASA